MNPRNGNAQTDAAALARPWVLGVRAQDVSRQVPLAEGTVVLGTGRGCAVVLRGRDVAREHARLHLTRERARLSVLPHATPALLNGVQVREAGLEPGDTIQVGDVQLTLHRAADLLPKRRDRERHEGLNGSAAAVNGSERREPSASAEVVESAGGRETNGAADAMLDADVTANAHGTVVDVQAVFAATSRNGHRGANANALAFLETLLLWGLRGPSSLRAEMLASLCEHFGAAAGCAFELSPSGAVTTVAAWGDPLPALDEAMAVLPSAETKAGAQSGVDAIALVASSEWTIAAFPTPSGSRFGLFVRGASLADDTPELLRLAVRLFGHDYLRDRASGARVEPPTVRGLVFPPDVVIGRSPAMRRLYEELATVVDGQLPVLVLGETGVGKEHIARVLHDSSSRRERPFVTINCAAIPADLLEAELFGIERGVATGVIERIGKFREAHGGTLFLDEIGELPLPLQSKLLRVLEEKKVQPVGGQAAAVDLRIVAATNVPLAEVASSGRFRLDLFHRLAGFVVEVPPLLERAEDVPLLFDHFLRAARGFGARLSPPALAALVRHRWTGNVRELRHEAARIAARIGAASSNAAPEIALADLSPSVAAAVGGTSAATGSNVEPTAGQGHTLDDELARIEGALIATALRETAGNVTHAAERLGISRARLRRRARELGLDRG